MTWKHVEMWPHSYQMTNRKTSGNTKRWQAFRATRCQHAAGRTGYAPATLENLAASWELQQATARPLSKWVPECCSGETRTCWLIGWRVHSCSLLPCSWQLPPVHHPGVLQCTDGKSRSWNITYPSSPKKEPSLMFVTTGMFFRKIYAKWKNC